MVWKPGSRPLVRALAALTLTTTVAVFAQFAELGLTPGSPLDSPVAEHLDQDELMALVRAGNMAGAFDLAFEHGDELFETNFNARDGVGANVGRGERFTRIPRADMTGLGQWAMHTPKRATGPNAISCNACHIQLFDDGSGSIAANVHRDPLHTADLRRFIQRNTPHVFALGPVQRVAEEMTVSLQLIRTAARQTACVLGQSPAVPLVAKGVRFGTITARRTRVSPCTVDFDTRNVVGVNADLVVRPFQWKGNFASVRDFNRDAAHNELGMQPVETTGPGVDGDFDGVADEFTVGDMTAMAIYLAAQPRPTTKLELASLGVIDPLPAAEVLRINQGRQVFSQVGCNTCHVPSFQIADPIFSEPSRVAGYRDATFPSGQNPVAEGVDSANPVVFDLTRDQPDNQIRDDAGTMITHLGALRTEQGVAIAELYGDLKRHNMGTELAESIDETGTGASTFLTRNLWGVGSTAPYLHDGRATTLAEAILAHGGEAATARNNFRRASVANQRALLAFLDNLVIFKLEEGVVVVPPPPTTQLTSRFRVKR